MSISAMGYEAYKKTRIQTADQGSLILICYDGAITFLKKAKKAQQDDNEETRTDAFSKAQGLLWELVNGLNYDAGEIAYNLEALYNYMIRRIVDADYHRDLDAVDEVVGYLQELRESWEKIIRKTS